MARAENIRMVAVDGGPGCDSQVSDGSAPEGPVDPEEPEAIVDKPSAPEDPPTSPDATPTTDDTGLNSAAKAQPKASRLVECPHCMKTMQYRTLRYSHSSCPARKKGPQPSRRRQDVPTKARTPSPPPPPQPKSIETPDPSQPAREDSSPPHGQDHKALYRRGSRSQRFAGLFAAGMA